MLLFKTATVNRCDEVQLAFQEDKRSSFKQSHMQTFTSSNLQKDMSLEVTVPNFEK